jgi:hypothetical protein
MKSFAPKSIMLFLIWLLHALLLVLQQCRFDKCKGTILASLFFISSCSTPIKNEKVAILPSSGFGGTGYKPGSGFGGTGNTSSGFGGTGIVGTVTQFGSIWVNGVEVGYDKNIQISSDLTPKDSLKLGQQVILETLPLTDKTLTRKIHIHYPIAGEITQTSKGKITVSHHYSINISQARMDKGLHLKKGNFVAVSGYLKSPKNWMATRISQNTKHKIFYHPIPKLNFSTSVKQVLIESTVQQLKQWQVINVNLKQLSQNHTHLLLRGSINKNRIQLNSIKPYSIRFHSIPFRSHKPRRSRQHKMQGKWMLQQQGSMLGMHRQQRRMQGKH